LAKAASAAFAFFARWCFEKVYTTRIHFF